jgi:hypothetical protein
LDENIADTKERIEEKRERMEEERERIREAILEVIEAREKLNEFVSDMEMEIIFQQQKAETFKQVKQLGIFEF